MPNDTEYRWIKIEAFGASILDADNVTEVGRWIVNDLSKNLKLSDTSCGSKGGCFFLQSSIHLLANKLEELDLMPVLLKVGETVCGQHVVLYLSTPSAGLLLTMHRRELFYDRVGIQKSISDAYFK
jgi:hypothetical protein